jgi:hypothetical protein
MNEPKKKDKVLEIWAKAGFIDYYKRPKNKELRAFISGVWSGTILGFTLGLIFTAILIYSYGSISWPNLK